MIRCKRDVQEIINNFEICSLIDQTKQYLTFSNDYGNATVMKYPDGTFTIYRKYNDFWDIKEWKIETEDLMKWIWKNRKGINRVLKAIK